MNNRNNDNNNKTDPVKGPVDAKRSSAVTRLAAAWIVLPSVFFVTAGTVRWREAWAYCAGLLVPMTVFVTYMQRHDPDFVARRLQSKEKERRQRRVIRCGYPLFGAALAVPGLDRRFGWSRPSPPPAAVAAAALACCWGSYLFVLRVFWENRWAGRTVETFRHQTVVDTGPYRWVRHPMYTGAIGLYLSTPLALGSWWGIVPAIALIPIFVLRIQNEEEVLLRELPGYGEYREKVPFRLVPWMW
jgi:protein-S-isoprenylcysteine O-methyltransferase Ste14